MLAPSIEEKKQNSYIDPTQTRIEQGSSSNDGRHLSPLEKADRNTLSQAEQQMALSHENASKSRQNIQTEIELLRSLVKNNKNLHPSQRAGLLEALEGVDINLKTSWIGSTAKNNLDSLLKSDGLNQYSEDLNNLKNTIFSLEEKEQIQSLKSQDIENLAKQASNIIQKDSTELNEISKSEKLNKTSKTLFNAFKKITGVKSNDENYEKLDEKSMEKNLQKEALKSLSLFDRVMVTINTTFFHKDDPTWLKDYLFKKVNISYLAKTKIFNYFYPDNEITTLRKTQESQKPVEEIKPEVKSEKKTTKESIDNLLSNRPETKDKLEAFSNSTLEKVSKTVEDRVGKVIESDLKGLDTTAKLNGLTIQFNKMIYEMGVLPSEEDVSKAFNKLKKQENFSASDLEQCEITEGTIKKMVNFKAAENQLMLSWINESQAQATITTPEGKQETDGEKVQQIFSQKLIDHIINYRSNLPVGKAGSLNGKPEEIENLKKEFAQSIYDKKIKCIFYQAGQNNIPILLIDSEEEQAKLYGSKNPKDKNKVSPGRFFFDSDLIKGSDGKSIPRMVSSVSMVSEAYKNNPEILEHELFHATNQLVQDAQRNSFRENYQKKTSNSNLVNEALFRFALSSKNIPENLLPIESTLLINQINESIQNGLISQKELDQYIKTGNFIKSEENSKLKSLILQQRESRKNSLKPDSKTSEYLLDYIEKGTTGIEAFDSFIGDNKQLSKHTEAIGSLYNRFYNPLNEAVTNYISTDRAIPLGDLKLTKYDKNNPEFLGGLALVRLLNEHNKSGSELLMKGKMDEFQEEKRLLANYLSSSPLFKNGRVTVGNLIETISGGLENEADPINKLLNVIIPKQGEEINKKYLDGLIDKIPALKNYLSYNETTKEYNITPEQFRIIKFLFPDSLTNDIDNFILEEGKINAEDEGIGKAINPDPFLRHAATNAYIASEYGETPPNRRTGEKYGGKLDLFYRPFHPKDPGSPLAQFWGWNLKTFTDGFGLGASKDFKLDSIDTLEALAFATGISFHRLPALEGLRAKMEKGAYTPKNYVAPSAKAYTEGVFKEILGSLQGYGGVEDISLITLMTKIGGYNFNLQGQPTLSNRTWLQEDEYRNNSELADFAVQNNIQGVDSKIRLDKIVARGAEHDIEKFKVGEMSKGYLEDILEAMIIPDKPNESRKGNNPLGGERMRYEGALRDFSGNLEKRERFKKIANLMMEADLKKRELTNNSEAFTLFDLLEACNTAQFELPKDLYTTDENGKRVINKKMLGIYKDNKFSLSVGGEEIGGDSGKISLQDAKEFMEYAIIARAERVMRVGVWGKEETEVVGSGAEKIVLPSDQNEFVKFISDNGFQLENENNPKILIRDNNKYLIKKDPQTNENFLVKIEEKYSRNAKIKTGAKVYGNFELPSDPIRNFTPEQMKFFFGKKDSYTITKSDGSTETFNARKEYSVNKGFIYDNVLDHLEKISQGKKLSYNYSIKLLQTDRYREFSKAQTEIWQGLRNIDNFYRFVIIASSAAGVLVPGMAFLFNPSLIVGLMGWSLVASPLIDRQANAWSSRMLAAIEAGGDIMSYSRRFYALADENNPPSFGDIDLARSEMETVKFKWRSVLTNMSKNAKWDTNVFTNIFSQLWGKVT